MPTDAKAIVGANVLALLQHRGGAFTGTETGITRLVARGIPNGTAQRVLAGTTSIGLDVLQRVAEALEVEPWQLLVPGIDPAALPGLTADPTAWPFPLVSRAAYNLLGRDERAFAQAKFDTAIRDLLPLPPHGEMTTAHAKERGAVIIHDSGKRFGT